MVVEAVTQTLENKGLNVLDVKSFNFNQIHLKRALVIPDDSRGVEVITSLRPSDFDGNLYHAASYDFSVTSVSAAGDGDAFTEHARGKIEFSFETKGDLSKIFIVSYTGLTEHSRHNLPQNPTLCSPHSSFDISMVRHLQTRRLELWSHISRTERYHNRRLQNCRVPGQHVPNEGDDVE